MVDHPSRYFAEESHLTKLHVGADLTKRQVTASEPDLEITCSEGPDLKTIEVRPARHSHQSRDMRAYLV